MNTVRDAPQKAWVESSRGIRSRCNIAECYFLRRMFSTIARISADANELICAVAS